MPDLTSIRRVAIGAALTGAALAAVPTVASASSCIYNPAPIRNVVVIDTSGHNNNLRVVLSGGKIAVVEGNGAPQICTGGGGDATVLNTDKIRISGPATFGADSIILDQSRGAFAPGATLETDGASEIEIELSSTTSLSMAGRLSLHGTPQADAIRVGDRQSLDLPFGGPLPTAINTAGTDADQDITWTGQAKEVTVDGGGGNDLITGRGNLSGLLGPSRARTVFFGGAGDDVLVDSLDAFGDVDFLDGGDGNDTLFSLDKSAGDILSGRAGFDTATTDSGDDTTGGDIEALTKTAVGRLRLAPAVVDAQAGKIAHVRLHWTHPEAWRELRNVELRLVGDSTVGTITSDPRTGSLEGDGRVKLIAGQSRLSHHGKTVTARLALRLPDSLAGQDLRVDVQATDQRGKKQLEPAAGAIRVAE